MGKAAFLGRRGFRVIPKTDFSILLEEDPKGRMDRGKGRNRTMDRGMDRGKGQGIGDIGQDPQQGAM